MSAYINIINHIITPARGPQPAARRPCAAGAAAAAPPASPGPAAPRSTWPGRQRTAAGGHVNWGHVDWNGSRTLYWLIRTAAGSHVSARPRPSAQRASRRCSTQYTRYTQPVGPSAQKALLRAGREAVGRGSEGGAEDTLLTRKRFGV